MKLQTGLSIHGQRKLVGSLGMIQGLCRAIRPSLLRHYSNFAATTLGFYSVRLVSTTFYILTLNRDKVNYFLYKSQEDWWIRMESNHRHIGLLTDQLLCQ